MSTPLHLDVLREYSTPGGWSFLPIHYSHDPAKGEEWYEHERPNYPTQDDWDREQEIDFRHHMGVAAYPNYARLLHVVEAEIPILSHLELLLACDFNVSPMVWEVNQIVNGWLHVVDEVFMDPAMVDKMVEEFRNKYPAHPAGIAIYGDATGNARNHQTAKSDYDMMRIAFRGYPSPISWRVPVANPEEKDRRNAFNAKLRPPEGLPGIKISGPKCPELVADLAEVVLRPDQKKILKIYNSKEPYSKRTHSSDAEGYLIAREWPTIQIVGQALKQTKKKPRVIKAGQLLGDIDWNPRQQPK